MKSIFSDRLGSVLSRFESSNFIAVFNRIKYSRETALPCPDGDLRLLIIGIKLRIVARVV
ncbi:hypothetical protein AVDCRST_MAG84-3003 [uncultured Microcoleus sp.]|uniref:Uncharacterized protein n=1 Tax=uncultured Microcoleus sp. TaxID=259945 RepID=A0A6J4MBY6_9CYAN|nr:hypothetical protein AVDCRST_MAG84-3003 [uncultured Microcoleus sp.]